MHGATLKIVNGICVETCSSKLILKYNIYGIVHLLALMEFVHKFKKYGIKKYGSLYLIQNCASNSLAAGGQVEFRRKDYVNEKI